MYLCVLGVLDPKLDLCIKGISRLVIVIWDSASLRHALFALVCLNTEACENFFRVSVELPEHVAFLEPTL